MDSAKAPHDRTRYEGKNLFFLLVSICLPAAFLYLRLVLGLAATDSRVSPQQSASLANWSILALICFCVVQVICAWRVQETLPRSQSFIVRFLQYCGVLIFCLLCSWTGAVILEAFGLNLFLRLAGTH